MDWKLLTDARDVLEKSALAIKQHIAEIERTHSYYGLWDVDIAERRTVSEIEQVLKRVNQRLQEME